MDPLGDEIKRELARFGPAAGMAELAAAWPNAVGEGIARNAWPARFQRDGVLVITYQPTGACTRHAPMFHQASADQAGHRA